MANLLINLVLIGNLVDALYNATLATLSLTPSTSKIILPGFTLHAQNSGAPFPFPILTSTGFFETGIESFDCSRLIFGDFLIFSKVVCNNLLVNLSANSSTTRSGSDPVSSFFIAFCNSSFLSRFACSRYFLIISSLGILLSHSTKSRLFSRMIS